MKHVHVPFGIDTCMWADGLRMPSMITKTFSTDDPTDFVNCVKVGKIDLRDVIVISPEALHRRRWQKHTVDAPKKAIFGGFIASLSERICSGAQLNGEFLRNSQTQRKRFL